MKKPLAMVLGVGAALLALVYGAVLGIESESGQRFIERHASSATGRAVKIGELDIKVGWQPGVRIRGLRISNPQWAQPPALIDATLVDARLRLMPLLFGRAVIDDLTLVQAKAGLEREGNRNTWSLREQPQNQDSKPSRVLVRRINIDRGFVVYRDTTDTDEPGNRCCGRHRDRRGAGPHRARHVPRTEDASCRAHSERPADT